jgi:hypothetical protein
MGERRADQMGPDQFSGLFVQMNLANPGYSSAATVFA